MKVYLVRHGETDENLAGRHQPPKTPLTKKGYEQAKEVANCLKTEEPTHLVSSSLVRAIETAKVIGEECDLMTTTNYRFAELKRPTTMYGHGHKSFRSLLFYLQWVLGLKTSFRDGAESYESLRQRCREAEQFLLEHKETDRIVVVSHSAFINLFTAHLCREKALSPWEGIRVFKKILTMKNAQVIQLEYQDSELEKVCKWAVSELETSR